MHGDNIHGANTLEASWWHLLLHLSDTHGISSFSVFLSEPHQESISKCFGEVVCHIWRVRSVCVRVCVYAHAGNINTIRKREKSSGSKSKQMTLLILKIILSK